MRHHRHRHLWLMATVLIALVGAVSRGDVARAADPDFTNVTDILGGQRHLLRDDDLVVTAGLGNSFGWVAVDLPTADSSITGATFLDSLSPGPAANATTTGRMFNHPSDAVLIAYQLPEFQLDVVLGDLTGAVTTPIPHQVGDTILSMAMGDFTGDGFADLVISYGTLGPGGTGAVRIGTAGDVNNPISNVTFGPEQTTGGILFPLAVGDFNGDGTPEIAGLTSGPMDTSTLLVIYTVDPTTLALTQAVSFPLPISGTNPMATAASLAAGRFGTTLHDQLVVAYNTPSAVTNQLMSLDFDASLQPTVKFNTGVAGITFAVTPSSATPLGFQPLIRSGRLTWFSQFDQAVVPIIITDQNNNQVPAVAVLTFDENLQISVSPGIAILPVPCIWDVAVGNFDAMQPNPNPPPATERDPNLSVALLGSDCGSNVTVHIFDPARNSWGSPFTLPANLVGSPVTLTLAAGDLQGRSLVLGAPTKVTITSHIQPDIVLGIPPMHIDYIRDVNNLGPNGTPSVLNISVIPSLPAPATAFNTQYSFSSSSSTSASRKNTTSYAFSTKETAEAKVSYGIPDIASVSVDLKTAAKQTHDTTVATAFNTYSGVTSNLSATTGFADHLFFTETRFNIYYYPVIGQTVCPAANPTCSDNEKLPLHVQFSGPDMVTLSDIDATTQEWYQPVWEPGNLFSYPWNLSLLQQAFPDLTPLTTRLAPWRGTDTSTSAYTMTWTAGSGSSQSSGSVNSTSIDVSVTVAAKASIEGFGIDGSAGFEVNSSQSVSTLNTSTQTLSASTGIQVNKPDFGDVVDENYLYVFGGYIFGQAPPTGTVQTIPLEDAQGNPIAIQATGPLTVGFVADPLREGLPWWLQAYTRPDVGLNHPARWNWSKSTQTASFNSVNGEEPALDQPFYHIKGLFITPQDANGTGPQLTTATTGEQLRLQARVYNYSLVDMPAGTQVHVRFYGQVYDNGNLVGNSFLIGEDVIGPIPGFNSTSTNGEAPNWALAGTTFDTTGRANQYLIFWVLVWMLDGNGGLLPELEGHGLTQNPASLTFAQITEVPTEPYSNNVGFYGYNSPFYVAAPENVLAGPPVKAGDLAIDRLSIPTTPILLDGKTKISVHLRTGDTHLGALLVAFYDGDPQQGGTAFDIQTIPHLRPNAAYQSRVFFRPQTCGAHTIVVVAGPATAAPATGSTTVDVTIEAVDSVQALEATTKRQALPQGVERSLLAKLQAAEKAFAKGQTDAAVHQLDAFINEVEAQRGKQLTAQQADQLSGQAEVILSCV